MNLPIFFVDDDEEEADERILFPSPLPLPFPPSTSYFGLHTNENTCALFSGGFQNHVPHSPLCVCGCVLWTMCHFFVSIINSNARIIFLNPPLLQLLLPYFVLSFLLKAKGKHHLFTWRHIHKGRERNA
jgi:hypothetical protein